MRIVYHLGAHCTDDERLLRCFLKNRAVLAAEGIVVPGPARYRTLLRDTAAQLRGQPANRETQALLLDQIMDADSAERLVFSWDNFMGYAQGAIGATLYPAAPQRLAAFAQIFPDTPHEFFLALRNPATFLPAMHTKLQLRGPEAAEQADPTALRWSDLVLAIRKAVPQVPLTVWCDEDTPLLWPEVLARVSGHAEGTQLADTTDLLSAIMRPEGMARMTAYLAANPGLDPAQRHRVTSVFLDKFALPEAIEQDIAMPGWNDGLIARLTADYDRDIARIMQIPGVTVLTP
ncbi:MAG: hypothetical protein ACT4OK_05725 [Gemmobacter sp.]